MVGEDTTTNLLIYRICHFWGQQHISTWFALESISRGDKKRETAWQELPSHPCVANVKHLRWSRRGWGEGLTNVGAPCHLQPAQVSNLCCPYNPSRAKYHQLQTLSYKHQLHISMMYFIFEKFSYGCETVKQSSFRPWNDWGVLGDMHIFQMFCGGWVRLKNIGNIKGTFGIARIRGGDNLMKRAYSRIDQSPFPSIWGKIHSKILIRIVWKLFSAGACLPI